MYKIMSNLIVLRVRIEHILSIKTSREASNFSSINSNFQQIEKTEDFQTAF